MLSHLWVTLNLMKTALKSHKRGCEFWRKHTIVYYCYTDSSNFHSQCSRSHMLTSDLPFFCSKINYFWSLKKECNSSKRLHVLFKIHIPFCAISGQFSLNSEWPTNAKAFVLSHSSLVTERRVATLAKAVCLTNYSYIFTHNVLEVRW